MIEDQHQLELDNLKHENIVIEKVVSKSSQNVKFSISEA
jgi:hypothetical protein